MGLLDDQDFDMQGYGGLLGPLLYRNPSSGESTLAQWARDAAAAQLARGRGGSRAYGAASGPGNDVFRAGSHRLDLPDLGL